MKQMSGSRVVHLWTRGNHCYSLMCSLENGKSCLFLNQHVNSHPDYVDLAGGLVDELFIEGIICFFKIFPEKSFYQSMRPSKFWEFIAFFN